MRIIRTITVVTMAAAALGTHPAFGTTRGRSRRIAVSPPVNVTVDHFANNEESLGMSPDGQVMAGSWNDWEYNDGCGFSYSVDGGDSWAPETFAPFTSFTNDPGVPGAGVFPIAGDPAVVYNPKSGLFDVICQSFGGQGNSIQLLSATFDHTKADPNADENFSYGTQVGGFPAWTTPVAVATGESNGTQKGSNGHLPDHETITVDTGTGPGHHFGRLFVGWAEFSGAGRSPIDIAYSDDDGKTWTGPIRVSDKGNQFDQDARPAVGPDGTVSLTWINGPNEKSLKNNSVMIDMSTDGGKTWGKDQIVSPVVAPIPGTLPNSDYRVFEDAWSTVDQVRGTVQVAFTDEKSGAANIYVTHNLVAGDISSWSTPMAVKPSGNQEFFPWLSSATNGRVDLVFYDRTCDPDDVLVCVTLASTSDGGSTWTTNALTTSGFDGDHFDVCLEFVDPVGCGRHFIGDYIAVASTDDKAQVLYTSNGSDALDVFSQKLTF